VVADDRKEALVRVEMLVLVPVDVVETEEQREEDNQGEEPGREAARP
jgi:hypothetical protein